jgi:hypothetical protein
MRLLLLLLLLSLLVGCDHRVREAGVQTNSPTLSTAASSDLR